MIDDLDSDALGKLGRDDCGVFVDEEEGRGDDVNRHIAGVASFECIAVKKDLGLRIFIEEEFAPDSCSHPALVVLSPVGVLDFRLFLGDAKDKIFFTRLQLVIRVLIGRLDAFKSDVEVGFIECHALLCCRELGDESFDFFFILLKDALGKISVYEGASGSLIFDDKCGVTKRTKLQVVNHGILVDWIPKE